MNILKNSTFQKYLLPGFVFQSVIIAGGYGTGRELVEFFLNFGPLGGLLGMLLISTVMWSVFLALTFEFARLFRAYDYRTFFINLLGKWWFLFEIIFTLYLFIVLAVIGSAAGVMLRDNFNMPYIVGVAIMLASVGFLTFKGTGLIEKFLSLWSIVLYIIYIIFLVAAIAKFGPIIRENFAAAEIKPQWPIAAFKYAFYNLANVAGVLFCLKHLETRKQALTAGVLAGVIGILPGLFFYIAIVSHYPDVLTAEIPAIFVFEKLGMPILLILFQIMLFGTLIETGTALIHSVNERINSAMHAKKKELPRWQRPLIATVFLLIAVCISVFGLINLIAKGYGAASWGFLFTYLLPLATFGLYKIIKSRNIRTPE